MTADELTRYLARIHHTGSLAPTLDTIADLMRHHVQAIPFENIDVVAGRGVSLDHDDVFDKLVTRRRGGYCFEHNGLFERVLRRLGFEVTPLAARSRVGRERTEVPPRTHLCLQVHIDGGAWLVDVGIGRDSLTAPLPFINGLVVEGPESRRLVRSRGKWWHQVLHGDAWIDVAELTGETMPPIDREIANWYTSAHRSSSFRRELMVARATGQGGRVSLRGNQLTIRHGDQVEKRRVPHHALPRTLRQHFGLLIAHARNNQPTPECSELQ